MELSCLSGVASGRGQTMATNPPSLGHSGYKAASSSRQRACRQRPVVLSSARHVELDEAHEQAALSALADLLAQYQERLKTGDAEST
jgi:hypothetical protein